jgi:TRAP transporter TAXI family solute receptor
MNRKIFKSLSVRDFLFAVLPTLVIAVGLMVLGYKYIEPAPPNHLTISTGDDQGDLTEYAKAYQRALKNDGVRLDIVSSEGPLENLRRLEDDKSEVSVAFVPDGLGSIDEEPDIVSLGSLYYEPIWIFYRGKKKLSYLSELEGKRIAVGRHGRGTQVIATRLLKLTGVDLKKTELVNVDAVTSAADLREGKVDAAIFLLPASSPIIKDLAADKDVKLMNVEQAEAISRLDPSFHHVILPDGGIDLFKDLPSDDLNLVASTATLLIRDDLHPALSYLLLKAAAHVHSDPGLFEKHGEFPANKDAQFPLSDDAVQFYKSGGPFWQRYLPYWLAAWFDRFILIVIPVFATVYPLVRTVPKVYHWRIRRRIYQRYGELKYLETQSENAPTDDQRTKFLRQLDSIEARVNAMRVPIQFTEHLYSLRGHINFVRERLANATRSQT